MMNEPKNRPEEPSRHYFIGGTKCYASHLPPALYIVSTPIGNLADITLRALETLASVDLIACEDTRVSRKLMQHYGISVPLLAYHEHNAGEMRPKLTARIAAGEAIALISDAGTPLISDPGYKLVAGLREAGLTVVPIPGPSAMTAAIAVAGLPSDSFLFDGFLPAKQSARRTRLGELKGIAATLILFETGPRLADALADAAEVLGGREAAICRELTKTYEEVRRGTLTDLAQHYQTLAAPKGEIVLVIAPPVAEAPPAAETVEEALRHAMARLSMKDAVAEVSASFNLPRRDVYQRALDLDRA